MEPMKFEMVRKENIGVLYYKACHSLKENHLNTNDCIFLNWFGSVTYLSISQIGNLIHNNNSHNSTHNLAQKIAIGVLWFGSNVAVVRG